jgi:type IV pilus assembly protein PilQ
MRQPRVTSKGLIVLAGAGLWLVAHGAAASDLNALKAVEVSATREGAQVMVTGSRSPIFTVFRLSDPDRLVVDVSSADAGAVKGVRDGAGPVGGVVISQFSDAQGNVARLLVALRQALSYDVHADGNRVLILVKAAPAAAAPGVAAAPAPTPAPAAAPGLAAGPASAPAPAATAQVKAEAIAEPPAAAPPAGEPVVAEHDQRAVSRPAHHLTQVRLSSHRLELVADGQLARYEVLELRDPARIALDVYGVKLTGKLPTSRPEPFASLRAGAHTDKVRLVLDVGPEMPSHSVRWTSQGLAWMVGAPAAPAVARSAPGELQDGEVEIDGKRVPRAVPAAAPPAAPPATGEVQDVAFTELPGGGRVEIKLTGEVAWSVDRPDARGAVLTLTGAKVPKRLERSLDTSALETPVRMVSTFAVPGGVNTVRIVVAADKPIDEKLERTPAGLSWRLGARGAEVEEVAVVDRTASFTTEAKAYAAQGAPARAKYTGKKVTFEFKDIDIHNLLRIISEVSKLNIVVADDVKGNITIRLRNVPWDEALDIILASKQLGKEVIGNVIRVAPLKTLEEEARLREERKKALRRQEDLVVQLLPVNYATATDLRDRVKDVLTERGTVNVDVRTNTLLVRDIASNISRARSLVEQLDTMTPQVLIESRIVEANTNFTREIGVQWGGYAQQAPGTNNATGLVFPNNYRISGGVDTGTAPATGTSSTPNFAVNLPAAVGAGSGGAIGMTFGSVNGAFQLNLRLSALETKGQVRTISAPKVTTVHNATAKITQGLSIPFSQVSAQGVNTVFVDAQLSLEVTPHITADGSVLMLIKATNNQPDPSLTGANGQPAISKKEAVTQVLVHDGDTTVIGGIYVRNASNQENSVPFLGSIPILGFFFKNTSYTESRQELLIFITPRILGVGSKTVAAANPPATPSVGEQR